MKKTKATRDVERVEQELKLFDALRWTDATDTGPDVPPPARSIELTTGWTFNAYSRRVDVACSSQINHSVGRTDKTTTQDPIALYSTRERALRALRCALEREFAAGLDGIDAMIGEDSDEN